MIHNNANNNSIDITIKKDSFENTSKNWGLEFISVFSIERIIYGDIENYSIITWINGGFVRFDKNNGTKRNVWA